MPKNPLTITRLKIMLDKKITDYIEQIYTSDAIEDEENVREELPSLIGEIINNLSTSDIKNLIKRNKILLTKKTILDDRQYSPLDLIKFNLYDILEENGSKFIDEYFRFYYKY